MESILNIFKIGNGPSSSHTMGPSFAVDYILDKYKNIEFIEVTLFGSLALTGKGHLTDAIIDKKLGNISHKILFNYKDIKEHPNTIEFKIKIDNKEINETIISIGGGDTLVIGEKENKKKEIYKEKYLSEILDYCKNNNLSLFNYVDAHEENGYLDYLNKVYDQILITVKNGLSSEGILPGKLKVERKAKIMNDKFNDSPNKDEDIKVMIASFAASEENASGNVVVTAPTCGSCGVIPGVITYLIDKNIDRKKIIEGLAVAGLFGEIVKTNASISGAVGGCQAEIGVASSMGAALIMHSLGYENEKIAQASEIALEHSLGLTCDPIMGYVQIPCIERNAIFALKAINSAKLSMLAPTSSCKITFDEIVKTMYETGNDIKKEYKETSIKGMCSIDKFLKNSGD